jgi:hypothetical protein
MSARGQPYSTTKMNAADQVNDEEAETRLRQISAGQSRSSIAAQEDASTAAIAICSQAASRLGS